MKKHIPNALAIFRLFVGLPILDCATRGAWYTAMVLIALGYASDLVDGRLARHWDVVSKLGKNLDLVADAVFDIFIVLGAYAAGRLYLIVAVFVALSAIIMRLLPIVAFLRNPFINVPNGVVFFVGMGWTVWQYVAAAHPPVLFVYLIFVGVGCVVWIQRGRIQTDVRNALSG